MAAVEAGRPGDKSSKKKPFSSWIKKMASLKSNSGSRRSKKPRQPSPATSEKVPIVNGAGHDETPAIQRIPSNGIERHSVGGMPHDQDPAASSTSLSRNEGGHQRHDECNKSAAPTLATDPDTINSDTAQSKSGASGTTGAAVTSHSGGTGSVFSSSNHSARSLTTTLTTIQSTAPSTHFQPNGVVNVVTPTSTTHFGHSSHASQGSSYFSHQFPATPASAIPTHLQPSTTAHLPTTYRSATANNLLSDNASILTLASSSHNNNHRRNSLDTAASIRAIAPSSQWGGSRESLPLSTISQTTESQSNTTTGPSLNSNRPSMAFASAERASLYSSQGIAAPALSSERNSLYRGVDSNSLRAGDKAGDGASLKGREREGADGSSVKGNERDGASMRSGLMGHGRSESLGGSISGMASSPLASPKLGETPHVAHD